MELRDVLNLVIAENLNGRGLCDYRSGTVTSIEPLRIKISDNTEDLKEPFIIVPSYLKERQVILKEGTILVREDGIEKSISVLEQEISLNSPLQIGDTVHLLMVEQGNRFLVISN